LEKVVSSIVACLGNKRDVTLREGSI